MYVCVCVCVYAPLGCVCSAVMSASKEQGRLRRNVVASFSVTYRVRTTVVAMNFVAASRVQISSTDHSALLRH